MNQTQKGILIKTAAIGVFAVMDACLKLLSENYGAFQVAFFRGAAAMPFLVALIAWNNSWRELKTASWGFHMLRAALAVSMLASIVYAFRELPLADAYSIFYAAPLFVVILSVVILKESVGWHRWFALIIGLAAVLFMFQPKGVGFSLAVIACLYSTFAYALLVIILKWMHKTNTTTSLSFYFTLFLSIGAGLLSVFDWQPFRFEDIALVVLLGLTGGVALLLLTEAYRLAPASSLAPFEYSSVIWAIVIGWVIWNDFPSQVVIASSSVLVMTGLYILHRERVHHIEPEPITLTISHEFDGIKDESQHA